MSSGPAEIMAAMATGLATVTNLSATKVSVNDWKVQNQPYSVLIFPSLGGRQDQDTYGTWEQIHRITVKLRIRDNDPTGLYTKSAAMIPLLLTWFRANDRLGLADVLTAHAEPLTWSSPTGDAVLDDGAGTLSKETDFTIAVLVAL